ncbi:hypothetical protein WQQ_13400 [Hydrocarboniphaga effusa AP103]|uniref:Uncharacterized protein n=1 Tax=Hydrocarboniphaga effusa AP103 TaxID=1172194 RepID=I8TC36_9GAMM|nr:hypothetical protein WQQ_13400 [Hydrocarboniphaga effusa AP103]
MRVNVDAVMASGRHCSAFSGEARIIDPGSCIGLTHYSSKIHQSS